MSEKKIEFKPSHKSRFWWYLLGFLLIPFLGAGLYILFRIHRDLNSHSYIVSDHTITAESPGISKNIDLANISSVEILQSRTDRKLGVGTILLKTASRSIEMAGIENPGPVADIIRRAAEAERLRLRKKNELKKKPKPHPPGTLDKMDYLTGLWQQGLISNEEFEQERKHFERKRGD